MDETKQKINQEMLEAWDILVDLMRTIRAKSKDSVTGEILAALADKAEGIARAMYMIRDDCKEVIDELNGVEKKNPWELKAEVEEKKWPGCWIDSNISVPAYSEPVLAIYDGNDGWKLMIATYEGEGDYSHWVIGKAIMTGNVIYWMPLPEMPGQ